MCHEFGHALTASLLYGTDVLESIEIVGNIQRIIGHTTVNKPELADDTRILLGGVVAEYLCGYTKARMHRGTDADRIKELCPAKEKQLSLWSEVYNLLEPHKGFLERLTLYGCTRLTLFEDEMSYYALFERNELKKYFEL